MSHYLFLVPLLAAVVVQGIKMIIAAFQGRFTWHVFREYGGMPSSHSALVVSVATLVGLQAGLSSPAFIVAVGIAVLVIRDATGYRQTMNTHAESINKLVATLPANQQAEFKHLDETIGHTGPEALVGSIIGALVAVVGFMVLGGN